MQESAVLANHAAGIVVGKVGTATVSRSELISDFEARDAHSAG
jgi:bifunctional ADP-heptose synthase (sugar kinase/adenylyltransferase)